MKGQSPCRWKRRFLCAVVCAASLAAARPSYGATPEECQTLRRHGHRAESQKCFEALTAARETYLRAEGYWGMEQYEEANNQFRIAVAQSPDNAMVRVRWGRLLHERFNNADADGLFKEALEKDPKNAQAYYGLALVSADGFDSKAKEYAAKAIELDPKLYEAHELLANLYLEDSDTAKALAEADAALKISPE
ncbi:MAG: tetratricopeptide repeat protein, partial [Candidatus Acidiferrales bacterium]